MAYHGAETCGPAGFSPVGILLCLTAVAFLNGVSGSWSPILALERSAVRMTAMAGWPTPSQARDTPVNFRLGEQMPGSAKMRPAPALIQDLPDFRCQFKSASLHAQVGGAAPDTRSGTEQQPPMVLLVRWEYAVLKLDQGR
jgi:hypothetical protein